MRKRELLHFTLLLCFLVCFCGVNKGASDQICSLFADSTACGQCSPIKGKVISPFGYRRHHRHTGADIKLQKGDTVRAAYSGLVTKACPYFGYGNLVILKHSNNVETYYSHLSKCLVHNGDSVLVGEVVGLGGRTGRATTNHLHFEVRVNHVPRNPENYFDFKNDASKETVLAYTPVIKIESEPKVEANVQEEIITIQKGDTLYALSKRYGTTVKQLQELNQMENSFLKIGEKLKIK